MIRIVLKSLLMITALAGLLLLASIPNYSSKVNDKNFWYLTEGEITIDKTIHNFGSISVNGGSVDATFIITNNTKAPILLPHVTTSCGCTASNWTKDPIEPGQTGKVTATFNPKGVFGSFNKSITIQTSGIPERFVVRIIGSVERE